MSLKEKTKFSNPIIGLVEFVYEEERIECKKISVGEVDSEKYMREVMVILYYSFIIYERKKNVDEEIVYK